MPFCLPPNLAAYQATYGVVFLSIASETLQQKKVIYETQQSISVVIVVETVDDTTISIQFLHSTISTLDLDDIHIPHPPPILLTTSTPISTGASSINFVDAASGIAPSLVEQFGGFRVYHLFEWVCSNVDGCNVERRPRRSYCVTWFRIWTR